jgi:NSS family neurotransmitter:Na+ symporter
MQRKRATILIGIAISMLSIVIIFNAETLFNLAVVVATQYSEPMIGLMMCVFAGWVLQRNSLLQELKKGNENVEHSLFWKIWPAYVRYLCPAAILTVFIRTFFS